MKLATAFLGLCVALVADSGTAFFLDSVVKSVVQPVAQPVAALAPALEAVPGVVPNLSFNSFDLLKFTLATMGVPVDHLLENSRKCVTELGPEAMGALKKLLGALTFFG